MTDMDLPKEANRKLLALARRLVPQAIAEEILTGQPSQSRLERIFIDEIEKTKLNRQTDDDRIKQIKEQFGIDDD